MNKYILTILTTSLGLMGCGGDSKLEGTPTLDPNITDSINAATKINFDLITDPQSPILVQPTYLLMDSRDGTLNTEVAAADANDISDPLITMGHTDGWSTSQPLQLQFVGNDLDSTTLANGFYLIESNDPTTRTNTIEPTKLTQNDGDFVLSASGTTLTVLLLKPLKPASNYMFAITSDLKDSNGDSVGMSNSYAVLKANAPAPVAALVAAQDITHATEAEFIKVGVSQDSIMFSSWFTTASVGDAVYAVKAATALALQQGANTVWKGSAISDQVSTSDLRSLFSFSNLTDTKQTTPQAKGEIYTGTIALPYFLDNTAAGFATTPWQSGMPSLAIISSVLTSGSDADKAAIVAQLAQLNITPADIAAAANDADIQRRLVVTLTGTTLTLADGNQLDPQRLITRFSPLPKLQSVQYLDYTLILPVDPSCDQVAKNATSIYLHGITSTKETVLALADNIINEQCQAIFAIDHPLHGSRAIAGVDGSASDGHPEYYLNLSALTVARDNLRQSTTDIIGLRAAIGQVFATIASTDASAIGGLGNLKTLDPAQGVNFIGHSLGAITGVSVANIANRPVDIPQTDALLFDINALALANPGGEIPYLLLNSGSFGDFVKGNLMATTNSTFAAFCQQQLLQPDVCFNAYQADLIAKGDASSIATLTAIYATFNSFAYAAQTVLDTIDPTNHAPLVSPNTGLYLAQVKDDATIPNMIPLGATIAGTTILQPYSPFTGTTPLISGLDLMVTNQSTTNQLVRNAILFNQGGHSSLLDLTINPAVTQEMQTEIASFINTNGLNLTIDNKSVITTTP
ncbi:lipase [Photobacterium aquimaris]|uniref:VolA/Pla-1 family phospholipase n=1 Tax=Photobacterium aquimaris TaxID=512643 RepID=UPI0007F01265|nr:VolA/Pla-1 family phospholipase [Photobacterium aquimaris]OBU15126.1 lipase [Photobacterium aquimaris]PSW01870.1 lipase [Photobacterium aquimaris]